MHIDGPQLAKRRGTSKVPQLDRAVDAPRGQHPAVRRIRDGPNPASVPLKRRQLFACDRIPKLHQLVVSSRGHCFAVWSVGHGVNAVGVPGQRKELPS